LRHVAHKPQSIAEKLLPAKLEEARDAPEIVRTYR
jgi:hypothetical protein